MLAEKGGDSGAGAEAVFGRAAHAGSSAAAAMITTMVLGMSFSEAPAPKGRNELDHNRFRPRLGRGRSPISERPANLA